MSRFRLIPKPEGATWTDDQWKAISVRGDDLLVAAAAGSGKTAVLVERIIRMVADPDRPVDVDRLLVATFTKAASDEMRQRIREALEQALLRSPDSEHLRRQLALLHKASITTLHSFCMEVVRRHFSDIGLDPGFRIANETETEMLRQDVLEELFEERYANSEEGGVFWRLVDSFSGERSDEALYRLVLELFEFSRSHPWPDAWLRGAADRLAGDEGTTASERMSFWTASLLQDVLLELDGVCSDLRSALHGSLSPSGPGPYAETIAKELQTAERLAELAKQGLWEQLYLVFHNLEFGKLKPVRGDDVDKQLQEQVKAWRSDAKDKLSGIREEWFARPLEDHSADMDAMGPLMQLLVELTIEFASRYQALKLRKGMVDFSDLEHYCLQVLRSPESTTERLLPSAAAAAYRERFVEVLLDEYQDTNQVQEAIVSLLSNESPGNRFMVGDVKQSIYRFRLAEPGLFLNKYERFGKLDAEEGAPGGIRIDLARNFRSRREVVDGINFVFRQIMQPRVGEIAYDEAAELKLGASYPDVPEAGLCAAEIVLVEKASSPEPEEAAEEEATSESREDRLDAETAQLEARWIAQRIRLMMDAEGFRVYDRKAGGMRPIEYRDIVVLLRATQSWAPVFQEEFRAAGIPCYADLNTGYFTAGEVETVISLLQVIDNPDQDIPLAAVLRSPIVRMSAEELALIRIQARGGYFYGALLACSRKEERDALQGKTDSFLRKLETWRDLARQTPLSELLWTLYRETGYYDLVGGMPGGMQRQANLRALIDRARQYESTSFRGLFRFLRFIERMKDGGSDLGAARALGEQEDVVRIMSIHKSKGLEFPVVFVSGLSKTFNMQDLNRSFLMHRELGFGPKFVDPERRISYPTLAHLAIKRRIRKELLAEELRILYVALTRAKEKLFLLATVPDAEKPLQRWSRYAGWSDPLLPESALSEARCYLDWLGPALIRHPSARPWRDRAGMNESAATFAGEPSEWRFGFASASSWPEVAVAKESVDEKAWEAVRRAEPLPEELRSRLLVGSDELLLSEADRRLEWRNPYQEASKLHAKVSVSELKRSMSEDEESVPLEDSMIHASPEPAPKRKRSILQRPAFMGRSGLTPVERGTAYHAVMQNLPLDRKLDESEVLAFLDSLVVREMLTSAQKEAIDAATISKFFDTDLGRRLLAADSVQRELPFSFGIRAGDVYPYLSGDASDETVVIQGVIDCLFEHEGRLTLLDYKTDALYDGVGPGEIMERYRMQLVLYAKAIEGILGRKVDSKALYLFDGGHALEID